MISNALIRKWIKMLKRDSVFHVDQTEGLCYSVSALEGYYTEKLKDMILLAIQHADDTVAMKAECLKRAQEYSEEHVIGSIIEQMGLEKERKRNVAK